MSRFTGSAPSRIPYVSMEMEQRNNDRFEFDPSDHQDSTHTSRGPPKDYFWFAIFSSIFCVCFGLTSLFRSRKVKKLYVNGDFKSSRVASKDAKAWAQAAVAFGLFWILTVVALVVAAVINPPQCSDA